MPFKIFGRVFSSHNAAAKAAKKKGIGNPDAYVATVERAQSVNSAGIKSHFKKKGK